MPDQRKPERYSALRDPALFEWTVLFGVIGAVVGYVFDEVLIGAGIGVALAVVRHAILVKAWKYHTGRQ